MTPIKGLASLVCVAVAGAIVAAAGGADTASPVAAAARLKTISTRVNAKGASVVIEATEPVAYVATRPDPLTLQLEFRNVSVDPAAVKAVAEKTKEPIESIAVEPDQTPGAAVSRVLMRVALTQPVAHRVRSDRNSVIVEGRATSRLPIRLRRSG